MATGCLRVHQMAKIDVFMGKRKTGLVLPATLCDGPHNQVLILGFMVSIYRFPSYMWKVPCFHFVGLVLCIYITSTCIQFYVSHMKKILPRILLDNDNDIRPAKLRSRGPAWKRRYDKYYRVVVIQNWWLDFFFVRAWKSPDNYPTGRAWAGPSLWALQFWKAEAAKSRALPTAFRPSRAGTTLNFTHSSSLCIYTVQCTFSIQIQRQLFYFVMIE